MMCTRVCRLGLLLPDLLASNDDGVHVNLLSRLSLYDLVSLL